MEFGARAAGIYRELADVIERPEKLPYIARKDPYDRRCDHVVLPPETLRMLAEQHGARLAGGELDDFVRYAVIFVLAQNGEAGTLCSMACTDGLIRALRELGDDARSEARARELLRNTPERWVHGAQFVTEVQGGSDAATNAVRAVPAGDGLFRLYGKKWFCSNCTADYWLVTARPDGAPEGLRGVALFVVPRLGGGRDAQRLLDRPPQGQARHARAADRRDRLRRRARAGCSARPKPGLKNMVAIVSGHVAHLQRARVGGSAARGVAHRHGLLRVSRGLRLARRPDATGPRRPRAHPARVRPGARGRLRDARTCGCATRPTAARWATSPRGCT